MQLGEVLQVCGGELGLRVVGVACRGVPKADTEVVVRRDLGDGLGQIVNRRCGVGEEICSRVDCLFGGLLVVSVALAMS